MKKIFEYFTMINLYRLAGFILLFSGVLFYIFWGITYNVWIDTGLISFVAPLIAFGFLTLWLADIKSKQNEIVKK